VDAEAEAKEGAFAAALRGSAHASPARRASARTPAPAISVARFIVLHSPNFILRRLTDLNPNRAKKFHSVPSPFSVSSLVMPLNWAAALD
jgi:hypothetical protein